jgi:hypothetical protein
MDFRKLWFTETGKEIRKNVVNGCFCTHESSCFYPSLFFDVKSLPKMVKETVKHQLIDWQHNPHQVDKISASTTAQHAPGYAEYEASLTFTTRKNTAEPETPSLPQREDAPACSSMKLLNELRQIEPSPPVSGPDSEPILVGVGKD